MEIVGLVTLIPPSLNRKSPWSPVDGQNHRAEHKTASLSFFLALAFVPTRYADGTEARSAPTPPLFNLDRLPTLILLVISKILFPIYLLVMKQA